MAENNDSNLSLTVINDITAVREKIKTERLNVEFSQNDNFYDEDITVEIFSSNLSAIIYYTTDGSVPTDKSCQYTDPIVLKADNETSVTVLRALAVDKGGSSEVIVIELK